MITLHLEGGWEKVAPIAPFPSLKQSLLYHQTRTLEAIQQHDLVMNSYNTGTGKTIASLLYLFDLDGQNKNVLFIAPTNALLAQHVTDIKQFVDDNQLNFEVFPVTAQTIRALESSLYPDVNLRPGELLYRLISNYLEFFPTENQRRPIILVVNPDIFYYALYFRYGVHDRKNLFSEFVKQFDYIVVDEFHYYDNKQLANFLFTFALFDQLGYFQQQRKICLLSATPTDSVQHYLNQLFGERWTEISPLNEPPESDNLSRVPTLTPLELTIYPQTLLEWLPHGLPQLTNPQQDGAIISSSLATVNEVYHSLRRVIAEANMGRITGPERAEDRLAATSKRLILATPTVDIGYNFIKLNKTRQNVDFVIFDARFGDELLQRLGRAGRILGKSETTILSQGIALLSLEAVNALSSYDGKTLSRAEFAQIVRTNEELPPKHLLTGYIRTYAVMECFWPIYQFGKILPVELQEELDFLFARIRDMFAPKTRWTKDKLSGFFRKFDSRQRWLLENKDKIKLDLYTAQHVSDWLAWLKSGAAEERIEAKELQPHLADLLANKAQWQDLQAFVRSQMETTKALFSFRDSFQGPSAVIYDPYHWLSSQTVNVYDLFHLIRNYKLSLPMSKAQFERVSHTTSPEGDFYFQLLEFRSPKLNLEFVYQSDDEAEVFEQRWCHAPVSLQGMRLQVRERNGDVIAGGLDEKIAVALANVNLTILIVPPNSIGILINKIRGTDLWSYPLIVNFPDSANETYQALLGKASFMAYAELQGHFLMKERLKPEPIIL